MNSENYWGSRGGDGGQEESNGNRGIRRVDGGGGTLSRTSDLSPSRPPPPSSEFRMQPPPPPSFYTAKSYSIVDPSQSVNLTEQNINHKNRYDDDNGGFDSGQGSSLDRNYETRNFTNPTSPSKIGGGGGGGGYYYNVPPPRDLSYHGREPSGLDLSNRENRGSAFELYKKPESRSPQGYPAPISLGGDMTK